jgi:putative tryptophan/tyrosine transport system substrate-binding protein
MLPQGPQLGQQMQFDRLKRREFITAVIAAAMSWPQGTAAQQPGRSHRLGVLLPSAAQSAPVLAMFDELRLNGFVEGQNLVIIPGGFEAIDDRLNERAATLIQAAPDVIVSGPELPLRALQALTKTVPLLGMTEDMVGEGLVQSLAHPGGNITGISLLSPELDGKRQQIVIEMVLDPRRIAGGQWAPLIARTPIISYYWGCVAGTVSLRACDRFVAAARPSAC